MTPVWRAVSGAWKLAYVVVVAAALLYAMYRGFSGASAGDAARLAEWPAVGFALGWVAMAAAMGLLWGRLVAHRHRIRLGRGQVLRLQARSWGGRYLPGKIGLLLGKVEIARTHPITLRQVGASVLFEQGAFVLAGLALAMAVVASAPVPASVGPLGEWGVAHWGPLRAALGALAVAAFAGLPWLMRRIEGEPPVHRTGPAELLRLGAGYVGVHLLIGLAAYPLVASLLPAGAAALGPLGVAGVIALAHVAGIVAVFAPAGLGVREAVFASAFVGSESWAAAIGVAALMRLVTVLADGAFVLACLPRWRRPEAGPA